MARPDQRYETARWRTIGLLAAFALLIGIGVVTVLLPELEDRPEDTTESGDTESNVQE